MGQGRFMACVFLPVDSIGSPMSHQLQAGRDTRLVSGWVEMDPQAWELII